MFEFYQQKSNELNGFIAVFCENAIFLRGKHYFGDITVVGIQIIFSTVEKSKIEDESSYETDHL